MPLMAETISRNCTTRARPFGSVEYDPSGTPQWTGSYLRTDTDGHGRTGTARCKCPAVRMPKTQHWCARMEACSLGARMDAGVPPVVRVVVLHRAHGRLLVLPGWVPLVHAPRRAAVAAPVLVDRAKVVGREEVEVGEARGGEGAEVARAVRVLRGVVAGAGK